jgi:nicotinamide-nucleotide amidase
MVVVTGSEILAGAFPDGHTHFLTRTLRPLGLRCVGAMTVDDAQVDIQNALEYATGRAELVIVTGGLGPTDNDVTCEAISAFTGIPVQEHPDVLAGLAERFGTPVEGLRVNLRRQTRVPVSGVYLKNANGTAVGLVFETAKPVVVALPGPPRELQPMVADQLIPYLSRRFGTRMPGSSLTVRFVGLGQSAIDERLKEHVPLPKDVMLSSQFDGSRVDFTFSLPEENKENRRQLEDLKQIILREFPENTYATEDGTSLEDVVIGLLKERGARLALAEMASGGSVESALSAAKDADEVLMGAYIAPDHATMCRLARIPEDTQVAGATDAQRADQLAGLLSGAASRQWAVVVGERAIDEAGSVYANVAICSPDGRSVVVPVTVRGNDPLSRARLTTQVVDELRKRLVKE